SDPHAEGHVRVLAERDGAQQLEFQRVRRDGRGGVPREAPASGGGALQEVRLDRRDQGALPRPRDQAPPEDRPPHAETAQAVRPRLASGTDPGVRLGNHTPRAFGMRGSTVVSVTSGTWSAAFLPEGFWEAHGTWTLPTTSRHSAGIGSPELLRRYQSRTASTCTSSPDIRIMRAFRTLAAASAAI